MNKPKSNFSPINKQEHPETSSINKNKNFDINFFVSHLASQTSQSNTWHDPVVKSKPFEQAYPISQKY